MRYLLALLLFITVQMAHAQEPVPSFAVPAVRTAPMPVEMADPTAFHASIVGMDGALRLSFADISVSARGWPLTLARTYAAKAVDTGLGPGWTWTFGLHASRSQDTGTFFIAEADGMESAYARLEEDAYEAVSGRIDSRLRSTPDGGFVRIYSDGSREIFSADFRLVHRIGTDGHSYVLEYGSDGHPRRVLHEDGQSLVIFWENGRVSSVSDDIGRYIRFSYQGGRLVATEDALGRLTRFRYDESGALIAVEMVDGSILSIEYDVNGRVSRLMGPGTLDTRFDHWGTVEEGRLVQTRTDAEGRRYRTEIVVDPLAPDQLSIVTVDPAGVEIVRDYRDGQVDVSRNGLWIGGLLLDGTGLPSLLLQPAGAVPIPSAWDAETTGELAHPDPLGRPRLVVNESGESAWQSYDSAGRVVAMAGATGRVERFSYDLGNRLVEHIDLSGIVTRYSYDATDRLVGWESNDGRWRKYAWSDLGLVTRISGHDIADFTLAYDRTGQLRAIGGETGTWTLTYDTSGNPLGIRDTDGRGTEFVYDEAGSLVSFTDESGLSVEIDLENGFLLRDSLGRVRGVVPDAEGTLVYLGPGGAQSRVTPLENGDEIVTTLLPDGSGWSERRDRSGGLVSAESLSDDPFIIETDENGLPVLAGDPLLPSTFSFDENGLLEEATDRIGLTSAFRHDDKGRLVAATSPYFGVELEYGEGDTPLRIRTSDGVTLGQEADALGRPTKLTYVNAAGVTITETMSYDERGRVMRVEAGDTVTELDYPDPHTVEMRTRRPSGEEVWREVYDPETKQLTLHRPDGSVSRTTFDAAGRPVLIETPTRRTAYEIDPEGLVLAVTTDGIRQELSSASPDWELVETQRVDNRDDETVRIETRRDLNGNLWRIGYRYDDFAIWLEDPTGGVTRVERASTGQITSVVDPEGRMHYAIYDDLGRQTEAGVIDGWAVAFGWEGTGPAGRAYSSGKQLWIEPSQGGRSARSVIDGETDAEFVFDQEGRLASASNATGTITIEYGANGMPSAITDVFGRRVEQEFDALGRLAALVLPEGDRISYSYPSGNTIRQEGPDGDATTVSYDPLSASYTIDIAEQAAARLELAANDDFKRLAIEASGSKTSFEVERRPDRSVSRVAVDQETSEIEIDSLGRMVAYKDASGVEKSWAYDGSGNIVAAEGEERSYDRAYRLVRAGEHTIDYDLDGRLTRDGDTRYQYTARGQLARVSGKPGVVEYTYDAFGQLVARRRDGRTEQYLWHDGRLLAVYDESGRRIALVEWVLGLPQMVRLHQPEGNRTLLPDHLGTPRFSVTGGQLQRLASYGPWGTPPAELAGHERWLGYTGKLQEPDFGLVHMGARVYLPRLARFNMPDPLGIENPVNPYVYASLQPLTFAEASGHNTLRLGFGPYSFGPEHLNPNRGLPTGSVRATPENRTMFGAVLQELENIVANEQRAHVRNAASRTLHVLKTQGLRLEMGPHVPGYGLYSNGMIEVNPAASSKLDPGFRTAAGRPYSPRAIASVLGHEGTHMIQDAFERRTGRTIGRMWRELEATMTGDLIERAVGGYKGAVSERQSLRDALDYAIRTEYRQYLPPTHRGHLANYFDGTGRPWRGLTQLDHNAITSLARKYYPNLPTHEVLEEFVDAHQRFAANPVANQHFNRLGSAAVAERARILREAKDALTAHRAPATAAHPRPPATPGARATAARPTIVPPSSAAPAPRPAAARPAAPTIVRPASGPSASRPTIEPAKAGPRASLPPQPEAPSVRRQPARTLPNARTTQRLPAADLPRAPAPSARASGGATSRPARPTIERPAASRGSRMPPATEPRPPKPRPPAAAAPPPRNPRPHISPAGAPSRPAGAPAKPAVKTMATSLPDASRPTGSGGTRTASLPPRPQPDAVRSPRPALDSPRPSNRGGRYPIPDLGASGGRGGRVIPPPSGIPDGASGYRPRPPRGASLGTPSSSNLAVKFGHGLAVVDAIVTVYQTAEYLRGNISHKDYLSSMALNALGYILPFPLNSGLAAHQIGSFLGGYLANKLLEEYRKGDPASRALVAWLRRNGWLNANDPTFVTVPERWPADLRSRAMLARTGSRQWIPVTVWSMEEDEARLVLVDGTGEKAEELGILALKAGATRGLLPPDVLAGREPGLYTVLAKRNSGTEEPVLALRIVAQSEESGEAEDPVEFGFLVDVVETRLEPTDLPWGRFDRPEGLIEGRLPDSAEAFGRWEWIDDDEAPGRRMHGVADDAPPIHYMLFADGVIVVAGDNLIQYLWLDPENPPKQVVLQIYDEQLSGAHRVSLGEDRVALSERTGFGFVQAGPLPPAGVWTRLRIPLTEIGMDGRKIAGIGFITDGGRALFGPTRLSGAEDNSPRSVASFGRDTSGAPQSDLSVRFKTPSAGQLDVSLALADGGSVPLYAGPVQAGERHFWWQGEAAQLIGAAVTGSYVPDAGEPAQFSKPIIGNPALVARILYPPQGAIVRQTVPIFGQAGGASFEEYSVEYRPFGSDEEGWIELVRSRSPTVMTDAEIRNRIDTIMAQELRSTVYGNLASLNTGSALHHFEFGERGETMRSGWVEIRLRSYDVEGNFAEAWTTVQVGEVVTGQVRSSLASPDGKAVLSVPPLALPAGMGTLSIDLVGQHLPAGTPPAESPVYGFEPSGLQLRAPVRIAIASEAGTSVAMLDRLGRVKLLQAERSGEKLEAAIADIPAGARFFATSAEAEAAAAPAPDMLAPWFRDARLLAAEAAPRGIARFDFGSIDIGEPSALVLSMTIADPTQTALILRFDGDARVVPIAGPIHGISEELAGAPLYLSASDRPQAVFLPLRAYIPPETRRLEAVELVEIRAAAWRTFVAETPPPSKGQLLTAAIGLLPEEGTGWVSPATWSMAGRTAEEAGEIDSPSDGWLWVVLEGSDTQWPVLVDRTAPVISDPTPEDGSTVSTLVLSAAVSDEGAGVDPTSLAVTVNDVAVPAEMVEYNSGEGRVAVALGKIPGLKLPSGAEIRASLRAADQFGRAAPELVWRWRYEAEPLAFGNLRQITVEGGAAPAWLPDGSGFVFEGERDGNKDIGKFVLATGEVSWLTDGEGDEMSPTISADGKLAYLEDGELTVVAGDDIRRLGGDLVDPAWFGERVIAGTGNRLVAVDMDGARQTLCEATTGAQVLRPRPFGNAILFTQQIYHRTIWLCRPETGETVALSLKPDAAATRDVDAAEAFGDTYVYFRDDGNGGLWQGAVGSTAQTLLLPAAGAIDRRPAVAADGSAILFDSDRTGRREVWLMNLARDIGLFLDSDVTTGSAGSEVEGEITPGLTPTAWQLVDESGKEVASLSGTVEDDRFVVAIGSDLPEGSWQLELQTGTGTTLRQSLVIDRTAPKITIRRDGDGADLSELAEIGPGDRFIIAVSDATSVALVNAQTGEPLTEGSVVSEALLGQKRLPLRATDAAGNRTEIEADLSVGESSSPRVVADRTEAPQTDSGTVEKREEHEAEAAPTQRRNPWIAMAAAFSVAILLLAAALLYRRRQAG